MILTLQHYVFDNYVKDSTVILIVIHSSFSCFLMVARNYALIARLITPIIPWYIISVIIGYTVLAHRLILQHQYYTTMTVFVIVAHIRMSYFVVGLTNSHPRATAPVYKQYRYEQYDGNFTAGETASVTFAPPATFRYVIIQQQYTVREHMCMSEVKVFERGNASKSKQNA